MSERKIVWMYSGQGSQYHGMGSSLYQHDSVFRSCLNQCDEIVRPWIGVSLVELIYGAVDGDAFDNTRVTHPAICAVQYAMTQSLTARGHSPNVVLGYSLGEVTARIVAGVIPIEVGLRILHEHAVAVEELTPSGSMLAILDSAEQIAESIQAVPDLWIAARNFDRHCVVTGSIASIDQLESQLKSEQITVQRLPVRCAFHSPLMDSARGAFQRYLGAVNPLPSRVRIVSATNGLEPMGLESLWTATREPVDFVNAIQRLEQENGGGLVYLDLGPSGSLSTFLKYQTLGASSQAFATVTPFKKEEEQIRVYQEAVGHRSRGDSY